MPAPTTIRPSRLLSEAAGRNCASALADCRERRDDGGNQRAESGQHSQ